MKRLFGVLVLVGTVLLNAGLLWAASVPEIALSGGVPIKSLPFTISLPGYYYLTSNQLYSGTSNAITVLSDNVTIDLGGFSLIYTGSDNMKGIYMSGRSNVEIRNGTVTGFANGVFEENNLTGKQHRIINVRAINNGSGIYLYGQNHLIKDCLGSNNYGYGLAIHGSGVITNSIANNNQNTGIELDGPGSVLGNTACYNGTYNFLLGTPGLDPINILVDNNTAGGLTPNYSIADNATGVLITDNNAGKP